MEAKELRIGNWVIRKSSGNYQQVKEVLSNFVLLQNEKPLDIKKTMTVALKSIQPIPLTPEILEKAGFVTNENKVEYVIGLPIGFGSDLFIENEDHESMSCGIKDYQGGFHYFKDIRYLHQLQNLFFAICGEELKIEL